MSSVSARPAHPSAFSAPAGRPSSELSASTRQNRSREHQEVAMGTYSSDRRIGGLRLPSMSVLTCSLSPDFISARAPDITAFSCRRIGVADRHIVDMNARAAQGSAAAPDISTLAGAAVMI
ncbi:hypothetical protein C8R44DRAFT_749128 [Mycena epipterygia]|nr:hypothetical protein C8R44DRAFT_749128 [Mycena epipterygia]